MYRAVPRFFARHARARDGLIFLACLYLSELFSEGGDGVARNEELATRYYNRTCDEWHPRTMERCLALRSSLEISDPNKWDENCRESCQGELGESQYCRLTCDDGTKCSGFCSADGEGNRYCNPKCDSKEHRHKKAQCREFCPKGGVGTVQCKRECDDLD